MKKIYFLLVMFTFCLTIVWSQEKSVMRIPSLQKGAIKMQDMPKFNLKEKLILENVRARIPQNMETFNFQKRSLRASAADDMWVFYPRPLGTYLLGLDYELYKVNWPTIVAPALRELSFIPFSNFSGATYTWTANNGSLDYSERVNENGELIFTGLPNLGYYMPELRGQSGSSTAAYTYGYYYYDANDEEKTTEEQFIYSSVPVVLPLTNADAWNGGMYGYVDQAHAGYFGSGAKNGNKNQTGVFTVFQKPLAPLYVKDIDIIFSTKTEGKVAVNAIPSGKTLTLNVYYLTDDGHVGDRIATSTITRDDIITYQYESQDTEMGFFHFSFDEVDDIGIIVRKTLLLKTAFVVELTGYDESYDFLIPFSENQEFGGSTYGAYGNEIIPFTNDNFNPFDAFVQLNGAYNCLEFEPGQDKLIVDDAGGYASFYDEKEGRYVYGSGLYSSFLSGELEIVEIDDWLTFEEFDESYYKNYRILVCIISGNALPADMTGRSGKVVIASEGITTTIYVKQGDAEWPNTGISTAKAQAGVNAVRQGDNFLLSYPAGVSSVSVYSITGQRVAEHKLNASGTYTLPAGNLAKGVYVLKFNGEKSTSVKILK